MAGSEPESTLTERAHFKKLSAKAKLVNVALRLVGLIVLTGCVEDRRPHGRLLLSESHLMTDLGTNPTRAIIIPTGAGK